MVMTIMYCGLLEYHIEEVQWMRKLIGQIQVKLIDWQENNYFYHKIKILRKIIKINPIAPPFMPPPMKEL